MGSEKLSLNQYDAMQAFQKREFWGFLGIFLSAIVLGAKPFWFNGESRSFRNLIHDFQFEIYLSVFWGFKLITFLSTTFITTNLPLYQLTPPPTGNYHFTLFQTFPIANHKVTGLGTNYLNLEFKIFKLFGVSINFFCASGSY